VLMAFEQGGIFIVPHLLWHGASVFLVSSEGPLNLHSAPFSRLLRDTRGCGVHVPIISRILTGSHSVASYDTQGDAKDLFLPESLRVHRSIVKSFMSAKLTCWMFTKQ
jgi:hypothetical protein